MAVDSKGLITWNPTAAQIGQYQVNLKVSDGSLVTVATCNTNRSGLQSSQN